jgi:hypothetical protein
VIAYPDISAAIQRIRGRLWPLGWVHLLVESKRTQWVNFNGIGVLPEYQGMGANAVLYAELYRTFEDNRFQYGDVVQIAENNLESMGDATFFGYPMYKQHRIYRRAL